MSTLSDYLQQKINRFYGTLRDEETLHEVFRRRLTKKEYKLLQSLANGEDMAKTAALLGIDEANFGEYERKLIKKINQSKIKEEILAEA